MPSKARKSMSTKASISRWPKITWGQFQSLRHTSGRYCGIVEERSGNNFFQDVWVAHSFIYDFQKKRLIQFHLETRAVDQENDLEIEGASGVDRYATELVILGSGEELNYRFFVTPSRYWNARSIDFEELHAMADHAHQTVLVKLGRLPIEEIRNLVEKSIAEERDNPKQETA
jgi:hypothetical protein